jgi:hypothetical protein
MNNHAWFYATGGDHPRGRLVGEREYVSTVEAICLNATQAAVLAKGRVTLHAIDSQSDGTVSMLEEAGV